MLYVLTEGKWSDYHIAAILNGPPKANLEKLQQEWAESSPLHIDVVDVNDFVMWLIAKPGKVWTLVAHTYHDTGGWEPNYIENQKEQWGKRPSEPEIDDMYCEKQSLEYIGKIHSFYRVRTEKGILVWECSACNMQIGVA